MRNITEPETTVGFDHPRDWAGAWRYALYTTAGLAFAIGWGLTVTELMLNLVAPLD